MTYSLSATKLQSYHRCPQSYYFNYEYGLKDAPAFGAATLGNALHRALAQIYWDWHYQEPIPSLAWLEECWQQQCDQRLSPSQVEEGWEVLQRYYEKFIAKQTAVSRPLAVEGQVKARLQINNIEFSLSGRYDRLDVVEDGLELIDYKSNKTVNPPPDDQVNLQLGLYYLGLEQRYGQSLKRMSLIYLRSGDKISFEATPEHKHQVQQVVSNLALQLRDDTHWMPRTGQHCDRCAYRSYCPAVTPEPEPLPDGKKLPHQIQLVLGV
jgi:putative RecB family exonuclease